MSPQLLSKTLTRQILKCENPISTYRRLQLAIMAKRRKIAAQSRRRPSQRRLSQRRPRKKRTTGGAKRSGRVRTRRGGGGGRGKGQKGRKVSSRPIRRRTYSLKIQPNSINQIYKRAFI